MRMTAMKNPVVLRLIALQVALASACSNNIGEVGESPVEGTGWLEEKPAPDRGPADRGRGESVLSQVPTPEVAREVRTGSPIGAAPAETKPLPPVRVENALLSLHVQRRPLVWVLEQITRHTQVGIVCAPELGEEMISIEFSDLSLLTGLQRLLSPWDAFFFFQGGADQSRLQAVWVYPEGQGRMIAPVPAKQWASTEELVRGLYDPDPDHRARSLAALIERTGQNALEPVMRALEDSDDRVRLRALDAALSAGIAISVDTLIGLAQDDVLPEIRALTLQGLWDLPGDQRDTVDIRLILEHALNDGDRLVTYTAQELLAEMAPTESALD